MATLVNSFAPSYTHGLWILSLALIVYLVNLAIYRLLLSTLAKFPGPKLWALTRLPYIVSLLRGNLPRDLRKIHEKYGDAVRVAPNEVSFATPDAWHDVYAVRSGQQPFAKDPVMYKGPPGQVYPMSATPNYADHARMRGLMKGAFTEKALQDQESIIQSYVDLLISSLRDKASFGVPVDMVKWFNYTTFDIVGDLGFGEPFDCLRNSAYHPWVAMIFNFFTFFALAQATRYYPLIEIVSMRLLPKKVRENFRDHFQLSVDKVHRRLNLEKQRQDFMTPVIELNADMQKMSLPEIESTFSLLIIAGSETTATTLSGITNYLIQNTLVLQRLVSEIRGAFKEEKDITIRSIKNLPYLNAVISEGLRLCNPIPIGLARLVPTRGNTVCGRWLPGNTHVSVQPYTIYTSPKRFHRPESFVPERWLPYPSCPEEHASDQLSAVLPFSLGPRNCIGKNLALFEMRLILARLAWAFEMEPVQASILDWRTLKTFITIEKQPVMVRLKARVGKD